MVRKCHFGSFRVVTLSTVTIYANREVVVPGKVCIPEGEQLHCCESLIEPAENKTTDLPTVVGRTLVTSTDVVPVRMMNITDEPCIIRKGTCLAHISSVSSVNSAQDDNLARNEKLNAQLEDLLSRFRTWFTPRKKDFCKYQMTW